MPLFLYLLLLLKLLFCLLPLDLRHILIGQDLINQIFLAAVTHLLDYFLARLFYHQVAVLAPDAVVSLVAEAGHLGNRFP